MAVSLYSTLRVNPLDIYGPPNERVCAYNRWYGDFLNSNQANELFSRTFENFWICTPDPIYARWDYWEAKGYWAPSGYMRDDFDMLIMGGEPYAHFPARDWIPSCPVEG